MNIDLQMVGRAEPYRVELGPPRSVAAAYEVVVAVGQGNQARAFAAALGMCWRSEERPGGEYEYDVAAYGGRVIDQLAARGVMPGQVIAAGAVAFNLLAEQVIPPDEVDKHEGNSEAPTGA